MCLSYCKQRCSGHWGTCLFQFTPVFLQEVMDRGESGGRRSMVQQVRHNKHTHTPHLAPCIHSVAPTLSRPMGCSPAGSPVHGLLEQEHWGDRSSEQIKTFLENALMRYHLNRLQPPKERPCSPRSAGRCEGLPVRGPLLLWSRGGEDRKHNPQWSVSAGWPGWAAGPGRPMSTQMGPISG